MRKKCVLSLQLLAFLLLFAQNASYCQTCTTENSTFKSGEEASYILSYDWFIIWKDVAEATLSVREVKYKDTLAYEITGVGNTFKSWDWIFKVRDKFISIVDKENLKPMYAGRDIHEGNYTQLEKTWFSNEDTLAISHKKTNNGSLMKDTISISACSFDIISAVFYARNLDFGNMQIGEKVQMDIFLDQKLYPISFTYLGIEIIKVKGIGRFECIKFSVMLVEGEVFDEGDKMTVWATNDENKIPVYAESPIIVGSVKMRLRSIKNNRYPISSYKD